VTAGWSCGPTIPPTGHISNPATPALPFAAAGGAAAVRAAGAVDGAQGGRCGAWQGHRGRGAACACLVSAPEQQQQHCTGAPVQCALAVAGVLTARPLLATSAPHSSPLPATANACTLPMPLLHAAAAGPTLNLRWIALRRFWERCMLATHTWSAPAARCSSRWVGQRRMVGRTVGGAATRMCTVACCADEG
jgi:hypothetical protein